MHKYLHKYPPASEGREKSVAETYPFKDLSAEEYAARQGWRYGCFSLGKYVYQDPDLNEWIHTLDDIFNTTGKLEELQIKFLTPEELSSIQQLADNW